HRSISTREMIQASFPHCAQCAAKFSGAPPRNSSPSMTSQRISPNANTFILPLIDTSHLPGFKRFQLTFFALRPQRYTHTVILGRVYPRGQGLFAVDEDFDNALIHKYA